MRRVAVLFFIGLIALMFTLPGQAAVETVYTQEIEGYYYIDNEILRIDQEREFTIKDYKLFERQIGNLNKTYVNITMTDFDTYGTYEVVTESLEMSNFHPTISYWPDGKLRNIEWDVDLFRDPTILGGSIFGSEADTLFGEDELDHKMIDLLIEPMYFTVSLEYYEYKMIDGEMQRIKVNSEFTTDNNEDGLILRTALHIIKRDPSGTMIYEYGLDMKEKNTASRLINLLDQPFLWVPFQLSAVFLTVYAYIRITRYIRENNITIVKGDEVGEETTETSEE